MLFLKRRLQLAAIEDSSSVSTLRTFLTSFLLTTWPQTDLLGRIDGDQEREVAVGDPKDQVRALLAEEFLLAKLLDDCCSVLGVDNGVAFSEQQIPPCRSEARVD